MDVNILLIAVAAILIVCCVGPMLMMRRRRKGDQANLPNTGRSAAPPDVPDR